MADLNIPKSKILPKSKPRSQSKLSINSSTMSTRDDPKYLKSIKIFLEGIFDAHIITKSVKIGMRNKSMKVFILKIHLNPSRKKNYLIGDLVMDDAKISNLDAKKYHLSSNFCILFVKKRKELRNLKKIGYKPSKKNYIIYYTGPDPEDPSINNLPTNVLAAIWVPDNFFSETVELKEFKEEIKNLKKKLKNV